MEAAAAEARAVAAPGRVRVRLVALLREAVGGRQHLEVEVPPEGVRLSELLERLYSRHPALRSLIRKLEERGLNIIYMVNGEAGGEDTLVKPGDVVTILPPASGG